MTTEQAAQNTDVPLFEDSSGASAHRTAEGSLGIDVGGYVVVKPLRMWHAALAAAAPAQAAPITRDEALRATWLVLHDETIPASNRFVWAVKEYRNQTGTSLVVAKAVVEGLRDGSIRATQPPQAAPQAEPTSEPLQTLDYARGVADERERCALVAIGPAGIDDEEAYYGRAIAEAIRNTGHAQDSRAGMPTLAPLAPRAAGLVAWMNPDAEFVTTAFAFPGQATSLHSVALYAAPPLAAPQAPVEPTQAPVATVKRGGSEAFGHATVLLGWESGADSLPNGVHALYALPPLAAPPGWKLVPLQWTSEMAHAGYLVHQTIGCQECGDIYRAMLAASPAASAPAGWTPMHERAPAPDTTCAVWVRYSLDSNAFATVDRWEVQREDQTGMGGPTIETGYGWNDNYEADVIAWLALPPPPDESMDQRIDSAAPAPTSTEGES